MALTADDSGYLTGKEDLYHNRWDADNVIPPREYTGQEKEWYAGYNRAYSEIYGSAFQAIHRD